MTLAWPEVLGKLLAGENLTRAEAAEAMDAILSGRATPAQVAGFALALRTKGETPTEVAALASVILDRAAAVEAPGPVIDTTGTGGDGAGTINISTVAGIVAAGAGVAVAKHGGGAVSSRCGAADLLEALGVTVHLPPEGVTRCLGEVGIAFLSVSAFHPSLAHAAGPRGDLGVATVFDLLGPLTNPARPAGQVVGVADRARLPVVAGVLAERGTRAYVVRGTDGLDEMTITGPTEVYDVDHGAAMQLHLLPIEVGVSVGRIERLAGGDPATNAHLAGRILEGEPGPPRDVVALNAAAALVVGGIAEDLHDGLQRARDSIDSGRAAGVLSRWIEVSNRS
jgi:anthranilate phosphoribosyltransferase